MLIFIIWLEWTSILLFQFTAHSMMMPGHNASPQEDFDVAREKMNGAQAIKGPNTGNR